MRPRHALVPLLLLATVLALACGGDGDEAPEATSTPAASIVTSDDGKLTLSIPNGAMAEGTQVTATSVPLDQLPEELQVLRGARGGYLLGPDGLQFGQPVTATLTLDRGELPGEPENGSSGFALVSFNETAGRELLPVQTTQASLSDGTVAVSADISHLSYIGLTQSSLQVVLEVVPRQQPANSTFTADAGAKNINLDLARLTEPAGVFQASGQVSVDPGDEPFIGPANEDEINAEDGYSNTGIYHCGDPGPGAYGVSTKAVSVVEPEGGTPINTTLQIELIAGIECVAGGGAPTNTPGGEAPELTVSQTAGCEHTQPGVKSEFQKKGRVTDASGSPVAGIRVDEEATGPGLLDPDDPSGERTLPSVAMSATTDANGEFSLIWEIVSVGPYTGTVQRLVLPDGRFAVFGADSTLTVTYTVAQTCTPP